MAGGAAAAGAAAAMVNAIKASGVLIRVQPEEFSKLLSRASEPKDNPLIVVAEGGIFGKNYQYLMSYKGLTFFTKSRILFAVAGRRGIGEGRQYLDSRKPTPARTGDPIWRRGAGGFERGDSASAKRSAVRLRDAHNGNQRVDPGAPPEFDERERGRRRYVSVLRDHRAHYHTCDARSSRGVSVCGHVLLALAHPWPAHVTAGALTAQTEGRSERRSLVPAWVPYHRSIPIARCRFSLRRLRAEWKRRTRIRGHA